jgi:hypothetical protein
MNKQMRLLLDDDWAPLQDWWNPSLEAERQRSHPGPDPFKSGRPSPFRQLPSADASCILVDSAHSFHIKGFGVDWCASSIVMGCRKGFFGRGSLDAQLERAYGEFQAFCAQQRKLTCCDHWSKLKMDMTRNTDFPSSIAGKGFDTAVCCGWLEHFFQDKVGVLLNKNFLCVQQISVSLICNFFPWDQEISGDDELEIMFFCLKLINNFFRKLNSTGLWLTHREQVEAHDWARKFCEGFSQLASMQASQGFRMYRIRPKMHMFLELIKQNSGPNWCLNPINAGCWNDEDFIGRCSAISKSCFGLGLSQSLRCLQKVLGKYRQQFGNLNV